MEWNLVFARNEFLNLLLNLLIANPDLLIANSDLLLANSDLLLANPDLLIANPDLLIANPDLLIANFCRLIANPSSRRYSHFRAGQRVNVEKLSSGWRAFSIHPRLPAICRTFGFHSHRKTAKCLICRTFQIGSISLEKLTALLYQRNSLKKCVCGIDMESTLSGANYVVSFSR